MSDEFEPWTRVTVETRDDEKQNYEIVIVLEDNDECQTEIMEVVHENRLRPILHTEMMYDEENGVLCEAIYIKITKEKAQVKKDDGQSIMDIAEKWTKVSFIDKKPEKKGE